MSKLILVKAGATEWQAQGRVVGDTDLRLSETGHRQAAANATAIAELQPSIIHHGEDQPSRETAEIIANELHLKLKRSESLREMDLGHWQGLTVEQLRDRFAKVYKAWREEPLSVTPPEGEAISTGLARLNSAILKIVKKKTAQKPVALVIGGYAYGALRCELGDGGWEAFWQHVETDRDPVVLEIASVLTLLSSPAE